jgi:diguanylate cyclase
MPGLVQTIVRETGIDPGRIDLEITETAVIKDLDGARNILNSLRDIGVHVVLDDFGAGYSSLQMLKTLPLDKIKIDRSLLQDVGRTTEANAILGAILRLSRTLDLKATAEGVETQEQLAVLRREKCEELQGYLLGRPAPIATYGTTVFELPRRRSA